MQKAGSMYHYAPLPDLTRWIPLYCYIKLNNSYNIKKLTKEILVKGIVTAPILYAMEEFPQLAEVVDRGFDDPADVDLVSIITILISSQIIAYAQHTNFFQKISTQRSDDLAVKVMYVLSNKKTCIFFKVSGRNAH